MPLLLAVASIAIGFAQEAARAEVDATRIGIEDTVLLTITVGGDHEGPPEVPALSGFEVRGRSRSTNVTISGGGMSHEVRWVFTLQPTRTGALTIPPIQVPGYAPTDPVTVQVESGSVRPRAPAFDPFGSPFDSLFGRRPGAIPSVDPDDFFIRAEAAHRDVRVGEQVLVLYRLYSRLPVLFAQETGGSRPEGFWIEDVTLPDAPWLERGLSREDILARRALPGPTRERRTVDGVEYDTWPILMRAVFPTGAGERALPGPTFEIGFRARTNSLFLPEQVADSRTAPAVEIRVRELPTAGRPPDFSGTVGDYRLSAELLRDGVPLGDSGANAGETLVLRIRLEGEGNLRGADPPALDPAVRNDFRVFDPDNEQETGLRLADSGLRFGGTRTWSFPIVPESGGRRRIGPARLDVFNPRQGAWQRLVTDPIPVQVAGATDASAPAPVAAVGGARFGEDIRYLHPVGPPTPARDAGRLYWFVLGLPALGNLAALALVWRRRYRAEHAEAWRRSQAGAAALARLKRVQPERGVADAGRGIAEALYRYAADRLGGSPSGLTPDAAAARFREAGVESDTASRLARTLAAAEAARYRGREATAPSPDEARELVRSLESELKPR